MTKQTRDRNDEGPVGRPAMLARLWRFALCHSFVIRSLSFVIGTMVGVTALAVPILAADKEFPEYQLKSAFLYNFAKFVTWPSNSFSGSADPIVIGVLGENPFGPILKQSVAGKSANGRPVVVREFDRSDDLRVCHVLFISRSEKERLPAILQALNHAPILTVSEFDGFAHNGGMINFQVVSASIRFEINLQAMEEARLQASSKLWGVGTIVKDARGKAPK